MADVTNGEELAETANEEEAAAPAAPADSAGDERLAYRGPIQRLLTRPEIGALIGTGAIWMVFWAVSDVFGTTPGTNSFLDVSTSLGIMAVAVALLMIGGEFDLSSGAMTGATGMLVVLLVKDTGELGGLGLPLFVAIPVTFLFAMGIGWVNGTLVEKTGLPSFIVTLGTFFTLRGAKLGFSKLFTDKVIVEGLDDAPDYEFWSNIFGGVWVRNDHLWENFLGGRDMVFAILAVLGAAALILAVLEQSLTRNAELKKASFATAGVGTVAALLGLIMLTQTDGTGANWTWSLVMGAGLLLGIMGYARLRFEISLPDRGSLTLGGPVGIRVLIGLGLVAAGVIFGTWLSSDSEYVIGILLTTQGLRAILFSGLVILGVIMMLIAARKADESPLTRFLITVLTAGVIAVVGFIIQSEADSRKFRAEFFAWIMLASLVLLIAAVIRLLFEQRRRTDPAADKLGRILAAVSMVLFAAAIALKLLWSTAAENEGAGITTYRVSILYFFLFAIFATWLLMRTKFGSWTFAVGGNKSAARQVGVPAARTKTQLFMMVSGAAWLVGMLIAFRLNSVQANVGDGNEFLYIIAAVVGGNLLTGGYGSAAGAAIGALIMAMSFQGIPFAGWNSDWRWLFVGVILLLAVMVNNYVRGKAEASK